MKRFTALAQGFATIAAAAFLLVYASDYLWFQYRMRSPNSAGALENVNVYYSTTLKSGKTEIFFDQPQNEICSRTLFPQSGHRPCWYARRKTIIPVASENPEPANLFVVAARRDASRTRELN